MTQTIRCIIKRERGGGSRNQLLDIRGNPQRAHGRRKSHRKKMGYRKNENMASFGAPSIQLAVTLTVDKEQRGALACKDKKEREHSFGFLDKKGGREIGKKCTDDF